MGHDGLEVGKVGSPELLVGMLVRNSGGSEGSKDSSSGKLHFVGSGGGKGEGKWVRIQALTYFGGQHFWPNQAWTGRVELVGGIVGGN